LTLQELLASAGSATSESSGDNSQDILTQISNCRRS